MRQVVDLFFAGSSPVGHPISELNKVQELTTTQ